MTTYSEEYEKAKESRNNAILSVRSLRDLKVTTENRRDDLLPILFGDGENQGLFQIISLYMEQSRLSAGRKCSTPDFSGDYETQYKNNLALCVKGSGDGEDGLYPPEIEEGQPTEKAQKEFNKDSKWLISFSLEEIASATGTGIKQTCEDLKTSIGVVALNNSNGRGPYLTQVLAEKQAQIDRGSGYLALRTENSEVYTQGEAAWYIGQNGIDTPDNYTFKSELLSKFDSILNALNAYDQCLTDSLAAIANPGSILEEFLVEIPSDVTRISQIKTQIASDILIVQGHKNYFSSISSGTSSNRSAINSRLETVKTDLTSLISTYETYSSQSSSLLGDANSGMRKSLIYWVQELVKKPDGAYTTLEGLPQLYQNALATLQTADQNLNSFSSDKNSWLPTPSVLGVFNQAILNLDKTINRWETHILWKSISVANKYKLYKKEITSFESLTNDNWTDVEPEIVNSLNKNGFLDTEKICTPPTAKTLFRIQACEESGESPIQRVDDFDSYSVQSDIISPLLNFNQSSSVLECSVIDVNQEDIDKFSIVENDFLVLNGSILAQIKSVSETKFMLDSDYGEINSAKKLFGFYFSE